MNYLSVMGTMGSGKTTVARLIAKELKFHLVEENFGDNAFLPRFYKNMKRWAFHSQTFFLMEKLTQLSSIGVILSDPPAGGESKDPVRGKRKSILGIVQDTPIEQDVYSYAKAQHVLGNMDDAEWKLYHKIYTSFEPYLPKPDLIIYLETSIAEIQKRIRARGREYEMHIPRTYFEILDRLNEQWLQKNKKIKVLSINTDGFNIVTSKAAKKDLMRRLHRTLKHS